MAIESEFKATLRQRNKITIPVEVIRAKNLSEGCILTLKMTEVYRPVGVVKDGEEKED